MRFVSIDVPNESIAIPSNGTNSMTLIAGAENSDELSTVAYIDGEANPLKWKNLMNTVPFSDGTYKKATGGYSHGVCLNFVKFVKLRNEYGIELEKEFAERLKKFAIYNVLIQDPDGESIQYGDQGSQKAEGWQYPELMDIFADNELNFILTRGERDTKLSWISYRFPESINTFR